MTTGKQAPKTYLIEVMPLTRGRAGNLSYFSTEKLAPGTIVRIMVRNSAARAVVLESRNALTARSDIRSAGYTLRKIAQRDIFSAGISPETIEAARKCATYYATTPGSLLSTLMPKALLLEPERFFQNNSKKSKDTPRRETLLLQMESEERFGQYRGLVRQSFAKKKSVMLIVPTSHDAKKARAALSPGIEQFVYTMKLSKSTADTKKEWRKAIEDSHPILFITTPSGCLFDRADLDMVIVERENSRAYRTLSRPYINYKVFIETLTKATSRQLVLGDSVLSLETLWREKNGDFGELSLIRWRLPGAPTRLVDTSSKPDQNGKFEIFSRELKELITKSIEEKEPIFLFGARKGLAPSTACGDCGYILPCLNCGAPVVLHKNRDGENIYICHACSTRRDSATTCGFCGSWKLVPLGIGIERIVSEVKSLFPGVPVNILDKDYAPTDSSVRRIIQNFTQEGGILVGTELAFFHIEKIPYSGLVSADALFSIPDFGIHERIFYLVSRLREMTQHEVIVQTRNIGKQVLAWAVQGNIIDFYQGEITERKSLLYPPLSIFIKITSLSQRASQEVARIKDKFIQWSPDLYKDSLIMRIPREEWPDEKLVKEISLLGPEFSIKVDPESIL